MNGVASVVIVGNITKDFEFKDAKDGQSVWALSSVAVNGGTKEKPTASFFNLSTKVKSDLHGKFLQGLTKGMQVTVMGTISIRKYSTQKGDGTSVDVFINQIFPHSSGEKKQQSAPEQKPFVPPAQRQAAVHEEAPEVPSEEDSIPF